MTEFTTLQTDGRAVTPIIIIITTSTASQLAEDADDILFSRILANEHHVLKPLLSDKRSHGYSLRPRRHNLSIAMKDDDRNFITRQLFKDIY